VDGAKCDHLHLSLAVDCRGNIGVGCTRTPETGFPSVYVMMHAATDPANTMRVPVLAVRGTTCYRYGDVAAINLSHYSSTWIDPSNPDLFWTYQAYGNSTVDKQWCTAWAAFQLPKEESPTSGEKAPASPRERDQKPPSVRAVESETFTDTEVTVRTSDPALVVVRSAPTEDPAAQS
jgi:hypothetical protein